METIDKGFKNVRKNWKSRSIPILVYGLTRGYLKMVMIWLSDVKIK